MIPGRLPLSSISLNTTVPNRTVTYVLLVTLCLFNESLEASNSNILYQFEICHSQNIIR